MKEVRQVLINVNINICKAKSKLVEQLIEEGLENENGKTSDTKKQNWSCLTH
jgi:hypothetical protein